jgi:hypothetical protein
VFEAVYEVLGKDIRITYTNKAQINPMLMFPTSSSYNKVIFAALVSDLKRVYIAYSGHFKMYWIFHGDDYLNVTSGFDTLQNTTDDIKRFLKRPRFQPIAMDCQICCEDDITAALTQCGRCNTRVCHGCMMKIADTRAGVYQCPFCKCENKRA